MEEIWRPIIGYEGRYEVSNYGRVKSLIFRGKKREKIIKQFYASRYYSVKLFKNNETKTYCISRLVAQAFIPNPDNKTYVDHIDTNRANNCTSNLRWVTAKENLDNPISKQRRKKAITDKCGTPVVAIKGDSIRKFKSQAEAAKILGINRKAITNCLQGKTNTSGGYQWKYA